MESGIRRETLFSSEPFVLYASGGAASVQAFHASRQVIGLRTQPLQIMKVLMKRQNLRRLVALPASHLRRERTL